MRPTPSRSDPTVVAVPFYFVTMAAEALWLRKEARRNGPSAGTFERRDTAASLAMGTASLVVPLLMPTLLGPFVPGKGRFGRTLVGIAAGAAAVTTIADIAARRAARRGPTASSRLRAAQKIAAIGGVATIAAGGIAGALAWAAATTPTALYGRRLLRWRGDTAIALGVAMVGWDFIYYWNHRFMHTSRYMWAVHVVHHSSQHYNLSTALRQPVADAFGTFVPYGSLCLLGISPQLVHTARGINLLYQYWIHTVTINRLGRAEAVLNSPSHHRVHHGVNREYLDRNHGGILITWDRLFGTFEEERAPVVYGLTTNIGTFDPVKIASHEYVAIGRDVAGATSWAERISFVVRGPGWAISRRQGLTSAALVATAKTEVLVTH